MSTNRPSDWGDPSYRDLSRMHCISDRSMPLARALQSGQFDRSSLTNLNLHQPNPYKVSLYIMALVLDGYTDVYPMVGPNALVNEAAFMFAGRKGRPSHGEWLDLVYSHKELPRCGSGPGWLTLSYMHGDRTAAWGRFFVCTFAAVRQLLGSRLDVLRRQHPSHLQRTSQLFNWGGLYKYWPWGWTEDQQQLQPEERRQECHSHS